MSEHSTIEWTDATWNPVTGCTKVSPGCAYCYAETFAERWRGLRGHPYQQGFDLKLWPERLGLPLQWKHPKRIFVNSMSDLFHEEVPETFVDKVFETMTKARHHVFQVLTKRSIRLRKWAISRFSSSAKRNGKPAWPANIWVGVSVENQKLLNRAVDLLSVPAAVRFLSIEPLLGPVILPEDCLRQLQWVIVGGESGPNARRMHPDWATSIFRQCRKYRVPFFFKQWGAFDRRGKRVGKKRAGRHLLGRVWDEVPHEVKAITVHR